MNNWSKRFGEGLWRFASRSAKCALLGIFGSKAKAAATWAGITGRWTAAVEEAGRGACPQVVRRLVVLRREVSEEQVSQVVGVDQAYEPVRVRPVVLGDGAARVGGARGGREQDAVGEVVDLPSADQLIQLPGQRVVGDLACVGEDLNADPELEAPATKGEESNGSEVAADGTVGDTVRRSDSDARSVFNSYVVNRIVE